MVIQIQQKQCSPNLLQMCDLFIKWVDVLFNNQRQLLNFFSFVIK